MPTTDHVVLDLTDLDAVGVLTDVIVDLRGHVMERDVAAVATVAAPEGWHRFTLTAMPGGHLVLGVRFAELTKSRTNNVAEALDRRGWQLDEDGGGATHRHPPGTDAMTIAFEALTLIGAAGAPRTQRRVTAVGADEEPLPFTLPEPTDDEDEPEPGP
ncbi:hypothetical protein [Rhabdothermincola salaria]|uniref:hypothetical protein n=1 Tax=Rhabdothermincola salaria TaxID=2903142 RepID=UPI001E63FC8A|nr:hypothetical protein [Rhabdothermincola salaria]MCD9624389.1 hypothetical protein [Rhabdothermincola salaria]